jgi:hypothetical protein
MQGELAARAWRAGESISCSVSQTVADRSMGVSLMVNFDDVLKQVDNNTGCLIDSEAVVVLGHKGVLKVLNEIGARIWVLADGRRSAGQIVSHILAEYLVDPLQAEVDTLGFLELLLEQGVLERVKG